MCSWGLRFLDIPVACTGCGWRISHHLQKIAKNTRFVWHLIVSYSDTSRINQIGSLCHEISRSVDCFKSSCFKSSNMFGLSSALPPKKSPVRPRNLFWFHAHHDLDQKDISTIPSWPITVVDGFNLIETTTQINNGTTIILPKTRWDFWDIQRNFPSAPTVPPQHCSPVAQ